jgi:hypothetical protein
MLVRLLRMLCVLRVLLGGTLMRCLLLLLNM